MKYEEKRRDLIQHDRYLVKINIRRIYYGVNISGCILPNSPDRYKHTAVYSGDYKL